MRFFAVVCVSLCMAPTIFAQGSSSLRGTVTDAQKAVIATAKVTLTDKDAGLTRSTVTSAAGEYQFSQVRPGSYKLTVESPGFAERTIDGLTLLVDTPSTMDVLLDVATSASSVSVNAEVTQLNTVDASVGNAFQEHQVQSLPLQTRNVVQLLSLQPGVTQSGEVMGARRDQNNVLLDGVDSNDNQNPLSGQNGATTGQGFNSALPVPLDSVQEFRVTVAGGNAFAGHSSGGQVSLVTRSGTNDLHGSAYEYNRNTDYTANNWFNNRSGVARPQLVRNQFGAALGGPVKKNRLFYFLNYEARIDSSQQSTTRTVPSETLKQGDVLFKTTNGATYTLLPADIASIDPLHTGVSSTVLSYLKQFPAINSPNTGTNNDGGLNFGGYIFNAPVKLDYRTYVGRFDWLVDSAGKHTVSFRGTLSNNGSTQTVAQFPGQDPASTLLSDNRGFGVRYTAVLTSSLVNTANMGVTRIGYGATGATAPSITIGAGSTLQSFTRGSSRINPTWNFNDDLNWVKGRHTVTGGINLRWIDNNVSSFGNAYPSYGFSRGVLVGLGNDIYTPALNYVANGNSSLKLSNSTAVTNAFGTLLGLLNSNGATYQYAKDGSVLPFGQPRLNDFITHEYEAYIQDSWKVTPKLTLTYGVHYEFDTVPFEVNGLQVGTTPGLGTYLAQRIAAADAGMPGNQLPNSDHLTFSLNGSANGKSGWYNPDKNNFAPRIGLAYSIDSKTVFRAGAGVTYDQFGNDMAVNLASSGSPGLSTSLTNASYNFTTSPRYANGVLPALPTAPSGGYPYTPPNVTGISGTFFGVDPSLHAPYTYLLNASLSRQFRDNYTIEVGYAGRLSRAELVQEDAYAPEIYFKDPKSGVTWVQNDTALANLANAGLTAAQVQANPSLVPLMPFVQDMFPGLANLYIPGSASANYFYGVYGKNAGSHLDNLHQLDRVPSAAFPNCIVATGCYTFFAPQGSTDWMWTNAGNANFHALVVTVRHALSKGFAFDFNYTWSHAIDNGSGTASGNTTATSLSNIQSTSSGVIQNPFVPSANRGDSSFDFRHQLNANFVYQLPFGKGKMLLGNASRWMDEIVGGWQISGLVRTQSGATTNISGDGVFNTNYWFSSGAYPINGVKPAAGLTTDQNGIPSLFSSTLVSNQFIDGLPGATNPRNTYRLPWQNNVDLTVTKDFHLPWERHTLQFRADAFNAFNTVNFTGISLSLSSPNSFGEFSSTQDARVLQLALRYSF
ncbi:MAG TPA: carboxypeptidase-like regulatory domain-containing protein [Bryobacteraceae bacterium]|nr:carboxypeptidase-like regulatory domain-containing protein [Bryobacteraceae bacterium]